MISEPGYSEEENRVTDFAGDSGIIVGFILAYLQQEFGLIKMGVGSFVIDAYPVSIRLYDILIIQFIVLLIGLLASWFTSRLMLKRT